MTLHLTLWRQSWSTSWTSWKMKIKKRLLQWVPTPSTNLMMTFIQTTSTHLVILMKKVCLTLSVCDQNMKPDFYLVARYFKKMCFFLYYQEIKFVVYWTGRMTGGASWRFGCAQTCLECSVSCETRFRCLNKDFWLTNWLNDELDYLF